MNDTLEKVLFFLISIPSLSIEQIGNSNRKLVSKLYRLFSMDKQIDFDLTDQSVTKPNYL